jgi:hypothetical protein
MSTNAPETKHLIKLTSAEIANLWTSYLSDTLAICTIGVFLAHVEDKEIKSTLEYALSLSIGHKQKLLSFFKEERLTIPDGFSVEDDVYEGAPRLFTDNFYLFYIQKIGKIGMANFTLCLANSARLDMCEYYSECLHESIKLFNITTEVMLTKGAYIRAPYIPDSNKVEYVQKQGYLQGLFHKRPLNVIEVSSIYFNLIQNQMGRTLLTGFSQVAKSEKVRAYMIKGREISDKHVEVFGSMLSKDFLPSASAWDTLATESITAPFSDKLMMMHVNTLNVAGIGHYGQSIGMSARADLGASFLRLMMETIAYAEDGANILIENAWLEEPPHAIDRDELAYNKDVK